MKKNYLWRLFIGLSISSLTVLLPACSDDDTPAEEQEIEYVEDQLHYFSSCLVDTDEKGQLTARKNGVPIPEMSPDTTEVFIGVDNLQEASQLFKSWLPDEAEVYTLGDVIKFSPCDSLRRPQGVITFAPVDGKTERIASVTFSEGCSVPYVSRLHFIASDAWPYNDYSAFEVGDNVDLVHPAGSSSMKKFVCIRKATKGQSCVMVHVTSEYRRSGYFHCAERNDSKLISEIMRKDWNTHAANFARAGMDYVRDKTDEYYYMYNYLFLGTYYQIYGINLKSGDIDWFAYGGTANRLLYVKYFGYVN